MRNKTVKLCRLRCPAVGVEIEERYCEIAAKRLSQPAADV
jgi:hypothetical protein